MIQVTPHMRIYVCIKPVDFRKGIDGLVGVCRSVLDQDPFSGSVFVFRNHVGTGLKILMYDGQGFWLCHKRLSQGRLKWWPLIPEKASVLSPDDSRVLQRLYAHELQVLLWNGNPESILKGPDWRRICPDDEMGHDIQTA